MRRLLVLAAFLLALPANAVDIDWVSVGGTGNACDPQPHGCFGAVAAIFEISKYEVTNAQYVEFLNAVAATDTYGLFNPRMSIDFGGITRTGSPGSYAYFTLAGQENHPVNNVSFFDAFRFANWLYNGQPTGPQDDTTTEDGPYTITAGASARISAAHDAVGTITLPSTDQWFKAAYYDPVSMRYFDYPAGTDDPTWCASPGATPNTANWNCVSHPGSGFTDVGSYTASASPNGTFDQGGNIAEWNETIQPSGEPFRGVGGGSWLSGYVGDLSARQMPAPIGPGPGSELTLLGFRVARVVEQCSNGIDDDGDGFVDLIDPGCSDALDHSERSAALVCDDGIDNDGDELADLDDPGCANTGDPSEQNASLVCDDGLDNDGDGFVDHEDPSCKAPDDPTEAAECGNGIDDDADGFVDLADPGCTDALDESERSDLTIIALLYDDTNSQVWRIQEETGSGTLIGLSGFARLNSLAQDGSGTFYSAAGTDLATTSSLVEIDPISGAGTLVAPIDLGAVRPDVRALAFSPAGALFASIYTGAAGSSGGPFHLYTIDTATGVGALVGPIGIPGVQGLDFASDGTLFGWSTGSSGVGLITIDSASGVGTDVNPSIGSSVTIQSITFESDGTLLGAASGGSLYRIDAETGEVALIGAGDYIQVRGIEECASCGPPRPECSNGIDDDGDTLVDYPNDPGCSSPTDPSEEAVNTCADGIDNDRDGLTDYPADPGCARAGSKRENPMCQDGIDNEGDGTLDFDGGASVHQGNPLGPADPKCVHPYDNREAPTCGLGAELALVIPLLVRLAARSRRRTRAISSSRGPQLG